MLWLDGLATEQRQDLLTVEEPLEIRLGGQPVAVLMRTPQDDFDLVAGFLYTEGMIGRPRDLGALCYCASARPPNLENIVEVHLATGVHFDLERFRRNFYASSSCGICGKASIEAIRAQAPPLVGNFRVRRDLLFTLDEQLRQGQAVFARTGSLHAAALFDPEGKLLVVREDVGRHNAVDKVIGTYVRAGQPPPPGVLMVSGRASFEIVQKALMAGIAVVAAVSAPSTLAVELARESGMTLVGFLRGQRANVYSGEQRLAG
ncbi:MAG: formate dehydrogenase accessory sulfurtransferase FdhD [Candidatus Latescibacteria bacterium]|nr:formate dehydrogenase accessory sulfurtransferase FdhD [Candidatus Latescibacterota bacterium]